MNGLVRVEIDPNIRAKGNQTLADYGDADGPLSVGKPVRVYESEAGIAGDGVVTEIDEQKRLAILRVDWPSLRPEER